jgi:two-component system sensor histidine kinase UhpB
MQKDGKHFKISFSGLNTQLFFFVILPISLLLLVITFGSLGLHQGAMRNLVGERDQRTVRSTASALREQLKHRAAAIQGIGIRIQGDNAPEDILDSVDFLLEDFDVGIAIYTSNGEVLNFTGNDELLGEFHDQVSLKISQIAPRIIDEPIFSEPIFNKERSEFYTLVLYRYNENTPLTVGIFSVTALARQTLSGILSFENQGAVVLIDQNKNLLFRYGSLDLIEDPQDHPGVTEALAGESGTTYFMSDDGEHVVAFSPVSPTDWALVIEEPWNVVASPMLRYSETGSLVLVPIVIFSLFALWFGTRKIIQPINDLQYQAISFTHGDYNASEEPVGGITEIQTLHETFIDMAEEVRAAQQTLKIFLGMVTTGQEEERKRLARELHDETLQSLIALNQRVMMIKRQAEQAEVKDALDEIETMIAQNMQELRRLTRALRPIYLEELGLVAAIEHLALETNEASNISVEFSKEGMEKRLPDHVEIAVFRISQEALSNIIRHSQATQTNMDIRFMPNEMVLTISDNGKGFNLPANLSELSNNGHYGLLGIHERAELIGAKIEINSGSTQGTTITLSIPLT